MGKTDPVCRVTLRDEWGAVVKTFNTKVKTDAGSNVTWNEEFVFTGFQTPSACSVSFNVVDADNGGKSFDRLGETVFLLGRTAMRTGPQEFEEEIAGVIFKSKVKFHIDNGGLFGSGPEASNKLHLKVKSADGLSDSGLFSHSPYVYAELVGHDGTVLGHKQTAAHEITGGSSTWDEELVFDNIHLPAAAKLNLSVYSGMSKVGSTQLKLGKLDCSAGYIDFPGTTLGGAVRLDFAMHTGGTWGNKVGATPVPGAKESQPGCSCNVM